MRYVFSLGLEGRAMEISVGQPSADGRYVAFIQCASRQIPDWCEPIIATWHGGRWHTSEPVYGWIGPLPVTKRQPLLDRLMSRVQRPQEYDL